MSTTAKPRQAPSLDACVEAEMEQWDVPGLAIAIYHEGAVDVRGYGVTSLETSQPVNINTLFQVGSITKVFTATLAMRLVESKRLELDEPVITYLPDLKLANDEARQTITMRHLLSHSSGLFGDYFDDFGLGDDALARSLESFDTLPQLSVPGALWHYGNSGFNLAGAVIEKVINKPFEEAMRERVFEPLKMERSFFFAHEAIAYSAAVGHTQEPGQEPQIARRYPLPRNVNPAGGIISTAEDMIRFAQMHLGNGRIEGRRVMRDQTVRQMREPVIQAGGWANSYGLGWAIREIEGVQVFGHGGSTNGFQAQLSIIPERDFGIVILTNSGQGSGAYRRIEEWAFDHYCGITMSEPRRSVTNKAALDRYAGEYRQPFADITVSSRYNRIVLDVISKSALSQKEVKQPSVSARLLEDDTFWITEGVARGETVEFIPDLENPEGPPQFIRYHGRLAERVEPEPEPEESPEAEAEGTAEVPAVSTQETTEAPAVSASEESGATEPDDEETKS